MRSRPWRNWSTRTRNTFNRTFGLLVLSLVAIYTNIDGSVGLAAGAAGFILGAVGVVVAIDAAYGSEHHGE